MYKDKAKERKTQAAWAEKNRDKLLVYRRGLYQKHKASRQEAMRKRKHTQPERWLLNTAKARAKKKGQECSITLADIHIPQFCPIAGIPIFSSDGKVGPNSPSIDRIDSTKGYVPGNVAVISHRANQLKSDMTPQIARNLVRYFDEVFIV